MSLKVFITGGTTGIGLALVKHYLENGCIVGTCGRDLSRLPEELKSIENLKTYQLNVTDQKALQEAIFDFSSQGLDLLIANAGRSHGSKSKLPDFDVARDIIEVNVLGVLNSFGPAVDIMLKQERGHIVAISSVAGFIGLPGSGAYSASKSAVLKLCESYSLDFKNKGIDVTCICPGFIDTPLTKKNDHSMPFLMDAKKAGKLIAKAIEKKKARYLFPWQMKTVILFLSLLPRSLYRFIMGLPMINYSKN